MPSSKPLFYQEVDGYNVSRSCNPEVFRSALKYKCQPGDIFICTYPKCGTTWMQHIVFLIFNKGKPPANVKELMTHINFLELAAIELVTSDFDHPTTFKTHLPFNLIPYSSEAKYIYVVRNPFDCCVSFYHHTKGMHRDVVTSLTFQEYFEIFLNGEVSSGDYFDHILSWYDHGNDANVLLTTYEEMKSDHRGIILKVAEFLGQKYLEELRKDDEKILNEVVRYSSFDYMKENTNNSMREFLDWKAQSLNIDRRFPEYDIVRKGIIGDWKNYFNQEQRLQLEQKLLDKIGNTQLYSYWKRTGCI